MPTLQNVNTHLSAVEVAPLFIGDNINVLVSTFGCGMSVLLDTLPTMSVGLTFQRTVFTVFAIHCPLSQTLQKYRTYKMYAHARAHA